LLDQATYNQKMLIRNLKHGNKWVIKTYLHFIRLLIKLAHILGLRKNLSNKIRSRLLNDHAFKRIDDVHAKSYDMLIEVNIGTKYKIISICVSANLLDYYWTYFVSLLYIYIYIYIYIKDWIS
jgi:hypothetical protein